jgi:hypothetical protein
MATKAKSVAKDRATARSDKKDASAKTGKRSAFKVGLHGCNRAR